MEFFAGTEIGEKVKAYMMNKDQEIVVSSINLAEIYHNTALREDAEVLTAIRISRD